MNEEKELEKSIEDTATEPNFNDVLGYDEFLDEDDEEQTKIHRSFNPKTTKKLKLKKKVKK